MSLLRSLSVSLCALLAGAVAPAFAADPFDSADEEDRVAVEALALYPEDVRGHILEASTETDRVHEVDRLQQRSQREFRELLEPYSENDQQDLFDLSRYPDLVEAIADGGPKGRSELERIASRYPEDVRAAVQRQGGSRYRTIVRMNELLDDFDRRFDDLVADLPPRKAQAFRALLGSPEVLSLMTEHDDLTVALGDAYERDPQGTRERFADLGLEVARRNAEEADDWKEAVDRDPDLRRDYEAASRDYQADTGYAAYAAPPTVNVVVNPYPYWVGYPWWYPVTYTYYDPWYWWYPRPYWGHVGWGWGPRFYAGFGGPVWRPWYPTPYFSSWYFSFGHHHAHYPYLTDRYVGFYGYHDRWDDDWDGPRVVNNVKVVNHYNFNKRVVKKFVYETDRVVSRDFLRGSREERVKRIREFGKVAPELEKVQREARRKELGSDVRRADRMRVPDRPRDAERAETQRAGKEILRKHEKDAPELARFTREQPAGADGEGRRGRGRGGVEEADQKGGRDAAGEVRGRDRGRDATGVQSGEDRQRDGDRGQARGERGGRDKPAAVGPDSGEKAERGEARRERGDGGDGKDRGGQVRSGDRGGRDVPTLAPEPGERGSARRRDTTPDAGRGAGRDRDADRVRERDADRGGKAARPAEPGGRATPTFERPGGEPGGRGDGGGGGARQGGGRKGGSDSDADRGDGGRKDGGRGDGERGEPSARSRSGGSERSASRAERRDSPSFETRAARPQVERESRREQPRATPEVRREQPRVEREVRREAPRPQSVERERPRGGGGGSGGVESQRAQPRAERPPSSGGGERQGGGGGGGGKRNKGADEEEQGGDGGGGGGGGRRR